jgi:DNA-binding SARP family transcriptional activator/tetratricopeptide (TPR) repeat protein
MRFRILGPLLVGDVVLTAARDRVVLTMLLAHADRVVALDELVDAVWAENPPVTARGQLQTCVSRLRRLLPPGTIQTNPAGYRVSLDPGDLDAAVFARLIAEARGSTDPDTSRKLLREALDLWRGPALPGITSRAVRRAATVLDEQHAVAVEDWVDLELGAGGTPASVAELSRLVEQFPLRERLRGQLMRALADSGRPAGALAEYDRIAAALRDDLGIEPGPALRDLSERIRGPAGSPVQTRSSLPRPVGDFTGHADLLARLTAAIAESPAGSAVQLIDGMPGIGKTALAVHLAGLLGDRFPDAHLFIDLHGHSDRAAVNPAAALLTLLAQLGVDPDRMPAGLDERAALWRSELAARRTVVVLDNAASSAQVRSLLPGAGTHLVLVTSRRRLTGIDGARPESVRLLDEDEARQLFGRIVGERAAAEPDAVRAVVRRCGRLPLAIRLAGARLAHRPRWRVADLLRRLSEAALPGLVAEDRTVAATFALSYGQLPEPEQRMFRLLGLHPGGTFNEAAAAALAGLPLADAEDFLAGLVDVHLVEEPDPGRYRLHDLLREYASSVNEDGAALSRLFDHVLHTTAAVSRPLESSASVQTRRFGEPLRPDLIPASTDPVVYLAEERLNLLAVSRAAEAVGAHEIVWQLARAGWALWLRYGPTDDLLETHERGLAAARALGDDAAAGIVANYLASGYHHVARLREAAAMLEVAHASLAKAGNRVAATGAMSNLAVIRVELGDVDAAAAAASAALADRRRRQDLGGLTLSLLNMGNVEALRGNLAGALAWHRRGLQAAVETGGNTAQRLWALSHVAVLRARLGHPAAERLLELAIAVNARIANRTVQAMTTNALAVLRRDQGRFDEAIALHRRALDVVDEIKERRQLAELKTDLADTLVAAGERRAAEVLYGEAGRLADSGVHLLRERDRGGRMKM